MGETGQNNGLEHHSSIDSAKKAFEKKFKDKTGNDWKNKDNFAAKSGKYLIFVKFSNCKSKIAQATQLNVKLMQC